jgi:hypothetical protein
MFAGQTAGHQTSFSAFLDAALNEQAADDSPQ